MRAILLCQAILMMAPHFAGSQITLTDDVPDEGQKCFKIETPNATYYYHKQGGALSSLVDKNGKDWIDYHPSPANNPAGSYRGIPNLIHKQGPDGKDRYFHPGGYTGGPKAQGCITTLESQSNEKISIKSVSDNGYYAVTWDFYATHATMTVIKILDGAKYWFLYEGEPYESWNTSSNFLLRSDTQNRHYLGSSKGGDIKPRSDEKWEWIFFGDQRVKQGLCLILHEDDSNGDNYYAMSPMTVFGFGRPSGSSKVLTKVPNTFSIGFVEDSTFSAVGQWAKSVVTDQPVSAMPWQAKYAVNSRTADIKPVLLQLNGRFIAHMPRQEINNGAYLHAVKGNTSRTKLMIMP